MAPKGLVGVLMGKEVPILGAGGGLGGSPRSFWDNLSCRSTPGGLWALQQQSSAGRLHVESTCVPSLCQTLPDIVTEKMPWWSTRKVHGELRWEPSTGPHQPGQAARSQFRFHLPVQLMFWGCPDCPWMGVGKAEDGGD